MQHLQISASLLVIGTNNEEKLKLQPWEENVLSASSAVHQCSSAMCNDSFSCREDLRNVKRISAGGGRKKKEEEIITIMIAITPKSEEKCREPQNCYSSFQNCLCVTDGKKSFLEAWGSFDVRAVCRQPGGEESCRC